MKDQIAEKWMTCPKVDIEFPGLAYIYPLDELIVAKKFDALHEVIGQKGDCYTIFNNEGQKIFLAVQKKKCRKIDLTIFNYYGNEVIQIKKPFTRRVQVWAPPGNFVGDVQKSGCKRTYFVKGNGTDLKVRVQSCRGGQYDVLFGDELVGQIRKQWQVRALMGLENYGVSFPLEMEVGDKAVLLGACFLIGYLKC